MTTELQRLVDGLAWRLRRNVAIDDPRVRLQAYSSHEGVAIDPIRERSILTRDVPPEVVDWIHAVGAARATEPFRLPLAPELGVTVSRLCVPIRQRGVLLGFLWILGDEPLSDDEVVVVNETVATIALLLQRDRLASELTQVRARELFRELITPEDSRSRDHAARELVDGDLFVGTEPALAATVTLHSPEWTMSEEERTALAVCLERVGNHVSPRRHLELVRHDHGVLLLSTKDPAVSGGGIPLAEELVESLRRELADSDPFVGLGEPVGTLATVRSSYRQAHRAATVARVVGGLGRVAPFSRLGVYGLLAHIPAEALTVEALPAGLVRLLDGGARSGPLLEALEVYLDRGCDARAAAKDLVIHRTTMYYRLDRIAALTGMDLGRGDDRLALHLGLKVARLAGLIS